MIHETCILTQRLAFSEPEVSNLIAIEVSITASCFDSNILKMKCTSL